MKISTFLNVNWLYGHLNALNIRRTKCINERERFPVSQIRYLIGKLCNCLLSDVQMFSVACKESLSCMF